MGMLNSLNQMLITRAFWSDCINFFVRFVGNYGWAIILFTIVLKLVLSPLDILQRKSMQKQMAVQSKLQPQILKLQEQYGNDRNKLNQKINELYQKNNVSMAGTCLPMLAFLVVTMVIFFTLFGALNSISSTKDSEIFYNLHTAYETEYEKVHSSEYVASLSGTDEEISKIQEEAIKDAVLKEYKTQKKKHGFLWVQNLWKSDTTTSPFVNFSSYIKYYQDKEDLELEDAEIETIKTERYETIISIIEDEYPKVNGYFLLIILAGVITFLVQFLSQLSMKKQQGGGTSNKIMLIIMPIIMIIFASTSNALFTLYIITNSIMSALISKVIDLFSKKKNSNDSNSNISNKSKDVVEYSRNYFKGN